MKSFLVWKDSRASVDIRKAVVWIHFRKWMHWFGWIQKLLGIFEKYRKLQYLNRTVLHYLFMKIIDCFRNWVSFFFFCFQRYSSFLLWRRRWWFTKSWGICVTRFSSVVQVFSREIGKFTEINYKLLKFNLEWM